MALITASRWIGILALAAVTGPWAAAAAWAANVKIGLVDFALRHDTLRGFNNVRVRSITFETSGFQPARFQSQQNRRGHADVMAAELIEVFQGAAPGNTLELYVASPFLENAATGQQVIDFDQLEFAYDWFARQGVKIVAQTFVARDNPKLEAAVASAVDKGLVILTSAGNGPRQNVVPPFPAGYATTIGISTTGLSSELSLEEQRNDYVRYSVAAPNVSAMRLRQDPELAVMSGSSRATVAAAGLLGALATRYRLDSRDDATALLDALAVPLPQFDAGTAYGMGVLMTEVVADHLRAPGLKPELKHMLLSERMSA